MVQTEKNNLKVKLPHPVIGDAFMYLPTGEFFYLSGYDSGGRAYFKLINRDKDTDKIPYIVPKFKNIPGNDYPYKMVFCIRNEDIPEGYQNNWSAGYGEFSTESRDSKFIKKYIYEGTLKVTIELNKK